VTALFFTLCKQTPTLCKQPPFLSAITMNREREKLCTIAPPISAEGNLFPHLLLILCICHAGSGSYSGRILRRQSSGRVSNQFSGVVPLCRLTSLRYYYGRATHCLWALMLYYCLWGCYPG